ncbi:hypothetical protein H5410_040788 [Solanum commersonii]|uniref:Uncharacterized protein n=1 Tax=Solanum commersonii TaxID=4109 RepID=A0A9J5XR54_SOLCO|nr:hypothetical protein H5410_040788 [Solanum commersonii]
MEKELQQIKSQQHDKKHAELSPSDDSKIPELEGDDGKHRKIQPNSLLHAATGTASTSATKEENKIRYANTQVCYISLQGADRPKRRRKKFYCPTTSEISQVYGNTSLSLD